MLGTRSKQCLIVLRKDRNGIFAVLSHGKAIHEPKFNIHFRIFKLILKNSATEGYFCGGITNNNIFKVLIALNLSHDEMLTTGALKKKTMQKKLAGITQPRTMKK